MLDSVPAIRRSFPAGNSATRGLVRGPEALRHCLATVLPIACFRRYMPRLGKMLTTNVTSVNRGTTNGVGGPKNG